VEHILHLTHCQPFLVQLVCGKLVQRLKGRTAGHAVSRFTPYSRYLDGS
jgi:hypothetical protein